MDEPSKIRKGMSQLAKDIWFYILVTLITLSLVTGVILSVLMGRLDIATIIMAFTPLVQYLFGLIRGSKNERKVSDGNNRS